MGMSKCKICRAEYVKRSMTHKACSVECAKEYARLEREKTAARIARKARQETRAKIQSLKTRREWLADAQAWVNKAARIRDKDLPCISCGRFHQGQWHGGHYLSRGAHPELALDLRNVHRQCQPCNTHLSGNQLEYRKGLIARYGQDYVDWLEGPHPPKKYTIEDAKRIIDECKAFIKFLQRESA